MAEFLVQGESIKAVADAIREKGGTTAPLSFPAGMAEAVRNIKSGSADLGAVDVYIADFTNSADLIISAGAVDKYVRIVTV